MLNLNLFRLAAKRVPVYRGTILACSAPATCRRPFSSSFRILAPEDVKNASKGNEEPKPQKQDSESKQESSNLWYKEPKMPICGALFAFIAVSTIYLSLSAILEAQILYDAVQLEVINLVLQSVIQVQKVDYDEYPFIHWDDYNSIANYFMHMCVPCSEAVRKAVLEVMDEEKKGRLGDTMARAAQDVHRLLQKSRESPGQVAQEVGGVLKIALETIGKELGLDPKS
uniref:Uncharacterized protein n=1 Tax=Moniliophthora roreri TaxID=221103 RepID=A0A0W0FJ56_MONRR